MSIGCFAFSRLIQSMDNSGVVSALALKSKVAMSLVPEISLMVVDGHRGAHLGAVEVETDGGQFARPLRVLHLDGVFVPLAVADEIEAAADFVPEKPGSALVPK